MKMSGNTIAITGGGSGIGRQLALRFSEFGNRIIVAGRRKESLEETIAGRPNMHALVLDVDDPTLKFSFPECGDLDEPIPLKFKEVGFKYVGGKV